MVCGCGCEGVGTCFWWEGGPPTPPKKYLSSGFVKPPVPRARGGNFSHPPGPHSLGSRPESVNYYTETREKLQTSERSCKYCGI